MRNVKLLFICLFMSFAGVVYASDLQTAAQAENSATAEKSCKMKAESCPMRQKQAADQQAADQKDSASCCSEGAGCCVEIAPVVH